jgi:hypothetical protein
MTIWYQTDAETQDLADWVALATNNGKRDVLVLYGLVPPAIYSAQNGQPEGSLAELFIESTDGDMILNHADWMFYVAEVTRTLDNGPGGLQNMMDNPIITMGGDNTPMVVTDEGKSIAPSLGDFLSDRPFRPTELAGEWFVEATLAENATGLLADPIVVRDGNRGRLCIAFETFDQNDPKGDVAAEIILWLLSPTVVVPPAVPTGLTAVGGDGKVTLDWNDNAEPDLTGYDVYRATVAGGPYGKVNTSIVTVSEYLDGDVTNGTTYFYVIRAVSPQGESDISSEASATPAAGGTPFKRADTNADGSANLTDAVVLLGYLFLGNPTSLPCLDAADANDSGDLNLTDAVVALGFLFLGNPPTLPPPGVQCGIDPTNPKPCTYTECP